jgi:hypothetical protein
MPLLERAMHFVILVPRTYITVYIFSCLVYLDLGPCFALEYTPFGFPLLTECRMKRYNGVTGSVSLDEILANMNRHEDICDAAYRQRPRPVHEPR